jgi:hypothetical protein
MIRILSNVLVFLVREVKKESRQGDHSLGKEKADNDIIGKLTTSSE